MEFSINRDTFLKSLGHAYGIIEKKTTLPILANILIEAKDSKIRLTATDLDIIYSEEIPIQNIKKEGTTTTDLVLSITEKLRNYGVVGKIVEVFGDGVNNLSVTDRATISNMSPEFGCTDTHWPIDKKTLEYFKHIPSDSFVDYYDKHNLNPVPLPLDTESEWEEHIKKRRNLFQ